MGISYRITNWFSFSLAARLNGLACKKPESVKAKDFFFRGLHLAGNTTNIFGVKGTPVAVDQIRGLNTLGISMVSLDYPQRGVNPPHTHPRNTEILTVVEGSLLVGFVTSNPENRLISKVLSKGDVFVFPVGLVHFRAMSNPPIADEILAKAFQVDQSIVDLIKSKV
ncbi:hypothetical protein RJ639_018201 [Escallonia herrerae]|uniref:Germin-like protein n=1 Tax=Escallonia herrerae TaxID=1293975 RepID=A0AA88V9D6_9ASTE|nr:hypothetical protein RJ639_018201 [Escallonia herrerae]